MPLHGGLSFCIYKAKLKTLNPPELSGGFLILHHLPLSVGRWSRRRREEIGKLTPFSVFVHCKHFSLLIAAFTSEEIGLFDDSCKEPIYELFGDHLFVTTGYVFPDYSSQFLE